VKDDGRLPTGSFKDRASCVGTTKAVELGFNTITCASTGNAASSLAGFSANLGLRAFIFVPAHAPEAKVAQLRIFRSNVLLVEGSYDDAYYLCQDAAKTFGWYNRNCAINPYLIEGKKTSGLEAAEQLAGRIPDWVSVAVGDGCTIAGIWKGFVEMKRFGIIDKLPRLLGVQASGAQPIYEAWKANDEKLRPRKADTLADSIAVGMPRNQTKALRAIRESGGAMVAVEDQEILSSMYELARSTGVFGEPAGVTGVAGLLRAISDGIVKKNETVLHIVSGNGLKDVRSAMKACPEARRIKVSLDEVRKVVDEVEKQ
jgi:threonine synthase